MTYQQAIAKLPADARLSCTFGYPGDGGYGEYHRDENGRRYYISNGSYDAVLPFTWTITSESLATAK